LAALDSLFAHPTVCIVAVIPDAVRVVERAEQIAFAHHALARVVCVATDVIAAHIDAYADHAVRFARGSVRVHALHLTIPIIITRFLADTAVAAEARVLFALAADTESGAPVEWA